MTSPATSPEADDLVQEELLLAGLRAGDEAAYERLIRAYGGRMLAAARRILPTEEDAEDAVQEAFLSAFRRLDTFQEKAQLGTWLHRIAINAALMRLRSLRRRREQDVEELLPKFTDGGHFRQAPRAWSEAPDEEVIREELRGRVRQAIASLPDNYRIPLVLRDIEGLDNEALAGELGVSVNAAKIRVHRARLALRALLDPLMNEAHP
jgi:RNA polymerase sigma-70 factor (ECF subfamily)